VILSNSLPSSRYFIEADYGSFPKIQAQEHDFADVVEEPASRGGRLGRGLKLLLGLILKLFYFSAISDNP
jgi:hypothetical protein